MVSYKRICNTLRISNPLTAFPARGLVLTEDFLTDNNLPGTLSISDHIIKVSFIEDLPVNICEDSYEALCFWVPMGASLLTNRMDLFIKEREVIDVVEELQSKKWKYEAKLRKIDAKITNFIKYLEV